MTDERPGKTGDFPHGKLNEYDEGGLKLGLTVEKGKVIVVFGTPITWIGLEPKDARGLAELLIRYAEQAEKSGE
jgi:hypothetical protein